MTDIIAPGRQKPAQQLTQNELPPLKELLLGFESLGDNCEFGVVQRQAGVEPLGLLRFSYASLEALVLALDCDFKGVGDLDNLKVTTSPGNEFMISIASYEFSYHTKRYKGEIEPEKLRKDEALKQKFLVRKLVGTLTQADKIIVRRGPPSETMEDVETLLAALRRYGPLTLLWVVEEDERNPARSVRLIAPNLICGRVGKLAPYHDAHSLEFTSWIDVCRGAHALSKSQAKVGTVIPAPPRNHQESNLLLQRHRMSAFGEGQPTDQLVKKNIDVDTICGGFPWRVEELHTICRHTLLRGQDGMVGINVSGLSPGQIYTFSVWTRLEGGRRINIVNALFAGRRAERGRRIRTNTLAWQQLEVSAIAPPDGMMYPRLLVKGVDGGAFYTGNWRLEPGIILEEICAPGQTAVSSN